MTLKFIPSTGNKPKASEASKYGSWASIC